MYKIWGSVPLGGQEFIRGLKRLESRHRGCVATIGSFDGVHLGHQKILERVKQKSQELDLPSLVIIFEPQPQEYFAREQALARLSRLREKVNALFAVGVDRVLCLRFDSHLRSLSAQKFIDLVLVNGIGVRHLVVGDDFRFGCDRRGDFDLLRSEGARLGQEGLGNGFSVENTETFEFDGERVSSTRIRALLAEGLCEEVESLLGKPYSITGKVYYGRQLGRTLNAATANIALGRRCAPISGVFAVRVEHEDQCYSGVANVGVKPSVEGRRKPNVEAHLFDFDGDLYGESLKVFFMKKIRDERSFDSLDRLKQQIERDLAAGRAYFKK